MTYKDVHTCLLCLREFECLLPSPQDKDFGKQPQYVGHSNPPAELSSSLKHYQQHSLERAYRGQDFFWGLSPTTGDYILIHFTQPLKVRGSVEGPHTYTHYNCRVCVCVWVGAHKDRKTEYMHTLVMYLDFWGNILQ